MAKGKGKAKEKQATDADLFVVDEGGDETLRRQILSSTWDNPAAAHARRGSGKPLKSAEILAQRSKVPSRTSKVQPGAMVQYKVDREKRMKITPELKKRLRGMVNHKNANDRGLWDVDQPGAPRNLQLSDPKLAGEYDMWASTSQEAGPSTQVPEDIRDIVDRAPPKAPATLHEHKLLNFSNIPTSITAPHPGESYNPTLDDHQTLLAAEYAKAQTEEQAAARLEEMRQRVMQSREDVQDARETGYVDEVGSGEEDDGEQSAGSGDEAQATSSKKKQRRKTTKEKKRRQVNVALEAQERAQNRLTKSQRQALSTLSSIKGGLDTSSSISLSQLHKRKSELAARLAASGLAGMRSGPSRVPTPKQAYLLSEELPESLRQLKTDGNLWNEWLDSSRRRGKIQMEKTSRIGMRKLKGRSLRDKEKVQWRKFDVAPHIK